MWVVIHSLVWDGKISNFQDLALSLLSPGMVQVSVKTQYLTYNTGMDVQLSTPAEKSAESSPPASSRLTLDSLTELSFVRIWNYFTDPNPSTRNLYLNIGFVNMTRCCSYNDMINSRLLALNCSGYFLHFLVPCLMKG